MLTQEPKTTIDNSPKHRRGRPRKADYLPTICTKCKRDRPERYNFKNNLCRSCDNNLKVKKRIESSPLKGCECGCGELIHTRKESLARGERKYKKGHALRVWQNRRWHKTTSTSGMTEIIQRESGYILVRVPDHPRADKTNGYVLAQILIMEDHIGRHLHPWEYVERINSIKSDNRIENLRLRIKNTRLYPPHTRNLSINRDRPLRYKCSKHRWDANAKRHIACPEIFNNNDEALEHMRQIHGMWLVD